MSPEDERDASAEAAGDGHEYEEAVRVVDQRHHLEVHACSRQAGGAAEGLIDGSCMWGPEGWLHDWAGQQTGRQRGAMAASEALLDITPPRHEQRLVLPRHTVDV